MAVNVALLAGPGVLGDLLERVIERERGFQLIARTDDPNRAVRLGGDRPLDAVVVCAPTGPLTSAGERLLESEACGVLVVISADGKSASLHLPRRAEVALPDPSPDHVMGVIRKVATRAAGSTDRSSVDG